MKRRRRSQELLNPKLNCKPGRPAPASNCRRSARTTRGRRGPRSPRPQGGDERPTHRRRGRSRPRGRQCPAAGRSSSCASSTRAMAPPHALKPVDLAFNCRRNPRHRRRERRRQIDADQAADRRDPAHRRRDLVERQAGRRSPRRRRRSTLGINAVHQEVVLCRHLSVAANIFLGDEKVKFGLLQQREMVAGGAAHPRRPRLQPAGRRAAVAASPSASSSSSPPRAPRLRGTKFLIFDEPTAYLTRQEAAQLFALIRRLQGQGRHHRLHQPPARRGVRARRPRLGAARRHARRHPNIAETNETELIALMINRSIEQIYHKETVPFGRGAARDRGLSGQGLRGRVDRRCARGEIVGLYGLIGAGRSEFVQSVFGRHPKTGGRDPLEGPAGRHPQRAPTPSRLGIALAPESRRDQGLCLNLPSASTSTCRSTTG